MKEKKHKAIYGVWLNYSDFSAEKREGNKVTHKHTVYKNAFFSITTHTHSPTALTGPEPQREIPTEDCDSKNCNQENTIKSDI